MRTSLFGVPMDLGTLEEITQTIRNYISTRSLHNAIIVANVHLLTEAQKNPRLLQAFQSSSLAVTDGMPLVWFAKKQMPRAERIVGVDLMYALCKTGGRIFLLGGAEGVAEALGKKLCAQYPAVTLAGTACPPFRLRTEQEEAEIISQINQAQPDILFVAFGAPKQELWIHQHKAALNVPVLIGVGAAFDYALGRLSRAPRWMQVCGMEWCYRFLQEPRRLFKRYAVSNAMFIWLVLKQYLNPRQSAK